MNYFCFGAFSFRLRVNNRDTLTHTHTVQKVQKKEERNWKKKKKENEEKKDEDDDEI